MKKTIAQPADEQNVVTKVPNVLWRQFKALAAHRGVSLRDQVAEAVDLFLKTTKASS